MKAQALKGKTVSMIGTVKNAGKTTALVRFLSEIYEAGGLAPAVTSIGRDGERTDVVTETGKPELPVREGTLVASASRLLERSSFTRQLIAATGMSTALGEVYVARALSFGYAEIGGPSMVADMRKLRDTLFGLGADLVLIDGAADRRSLGIADLADAVILCSGAGWSRDMGETLEHTAHLAGLFSLPLWEEAAADRTRILSGAVLEAEAKALAQTGPENGRDVLRFDDPSKLMFSAAAGKLLKNSGYTLTLMHRPKLLCTAVNPYAPGGWTYDEKEFEEKLAERLSCPVVNAVKGGILNVCQDDER